MRNLNTSDVFEFSRMIKNVGIKEEIRNISMKATESNADVKALGFDMIFSLIEKFSEAKSEKALYEFLSRPLEVNPKEVGEMDIFELIEKIMNIANIDRWKSFLKLAIR